MTELRPHVDRAGAALGPLAAPASGRMYEGRVARVHGAQDPLRYPWGAELRDAAELAKIVEQLPGKPVAARPGVVGRHPEDLLVDGAPHEIVGSVESARVDGDYAVARIFITDEETNQAIDAGMRELSLGYRCHTDADAHQRGTYVDHLAVVPRARCGDSCSLRADEGCACAAVPSTTTAQARPGQTPCACKLHAVDLNGMSDETKHGDDSLTAAERHSLSSHSFGIPGREGLPLEDAGHVRDAMARFDQEHFKDAAEKRSAYHRVIARAHELGIDPSGFEKKYAGHLDSGKDKTMDEIQNQLAAAKAALVTAEEAAKVAKNRADALEAERDNARNDARAEKTRADQAATDLAAARQQVRADADGRFDEAVVAKVALLTKANEILGATDDKGQPVDRTKMTERDLKVAVVKHVDDFDIAADKEPAYVQAMYDGATSRHAQGATSRARARTAIHQMRQTGAATVARRDADAKTEDEALRAMNESFRAPKPKQ